MASTSTTISTGTTVNPVSQPMPPISTAVSQPASGTTAANQAASNYGAYTSFGYSYGNSQYPYNGQYDAAAYAQYYNSYNSYYGYGQYNYQYDQTGQYNNYNNYYQTSQNQTQQAYATTVSTSQTQTTKPNTAVPPPPLPTTLPSYHTTQGQIQASVVTTTTSSLGQVNPPPPPPPPVNMLSSINTSTPAATTQTVSSSVSTPIPPPSIPPPAVPHASQGIGLATSQAPAAATTPSTATPGVAPVPPAMPPNFGMYSQPPPMMYPPPVQSSQQYGSQNNMQSYSTTQAGYNTSNYNYQYGAQRFQTPPPPLPNSTTPGTAATSTLSTPMQRPVVPFQPSVPPPNYPPPNYPPPSYPPYQHTYPYHNYNYNNQQMTQQYSSSGQSGYANQAAPNQANSTHNVNSAVFSTLQCNFSQNKPKLKKKKKGAGNSNDQSPLNNQSLNTSGSDTQTSQVRPDEKLVLRKDIGPANIAQPKGTFACLLGTVDFEIDEYDQSTESESDSEECENKNTSKPQEEKSKSQSKSSYPKPAKVTKPVVPLDNLEMNPEAFGLPTTFVGRGPKAIPEEEEEENRFYDSQRNYPYKTFQFNQSNFGQRSNNFEKPWNASKNWNNQNFRNDTNINEQPVKNDKINPNILGTPAIGGVSKQRENQIQNILMEMSGGKPFTNQNPNHHPNNEGKQNFNRNYSKSLNPSVGWQENENVVHSSSNVDAEDFDGRFQNYDKNELPAAFVGSKDNSPYFQDNKGGFRREDKPPFFQNEKDTSNRNMPPNIGSFHKESKNKKYNEKDMHNTSGTNEKPFYGNRFSEGNNDQFEEGFDDYGTEDYNQSGGNNRFRSKFPPYKDQPGFNRNPSRFSGDSNYEEFHRDSNYDTLHRSRFDKPNFADEKHNQFEEPHYEETMEFQEPWNFRQGPSDRKFGNNHKPPLRHPPQFGNKGEVDDFDNNYSNSSLNKRPFDRFDVPSNEETESFGDKNMHQESPFGRGQLSKNKPMPFLKEPMLTGKKHSEGQFSGNDIPPPFRSNQPIGGGKRPNVPSFENTPPIKSPFKDENFSKNNSQPAFTHPPPIRHPPPSFNVMKQEGNFPPLRPPPFLENKEMQGYLDRNKMNIPRPPFDIPPPNIPFGKMNEPGFSDDKRALEDHDDRPFRMKPNFNNDSFMSGPFGQRDQFQNTLDPIHGINTIKDEVGKPFVDNRNRIKPEPPFNSEPNRQKKNRFEIEKSFIDTQLENPFNKSRNKPSDLKKPFEKPFRSTSRFEDIKSDEGPGSKENLVMERRNLKEDNSRNSDNSKNLESSPAKKARKFFSDTPQQGPAQHVVQDKAEKSIEVSNKQSIPVTKIVGTKTVKPNETGDSKLSEDKKSNVIKNQNVTANRPLSPKSLLKMETRNSQEEKIVKADTAKNIEKSKPKEIIDSKADSAKESKVKVSKASPAKTIPMNAISFLESLTSGKRSLKQSFSTSAANSSKLSSETQSTPKEKKSTAAPSVSDKSNVISKSDTGTQSHSSKGSVSKSPEMRTTALSSKTGIPSVMTSASQISKSPSSSSSSSSSSITQSNSSSVTVSASIPTTSSNSCTKNTSIPITTTTSSAPVTSTTSISSSSSLSSTSVKESASETNTSSTTVRTSPKSSTHTVSKQQSKTATTEFTKPLSWLTSSSPRTSVKATSRGADAAVTTSKVTVNITSTTTTSTSMEKSIMSSSTAISTVSTAKAVTTTSISKEPVQLSSTSSHLTTTSNVSNVPEKLASDSFVKDKKSQSSVPAPATANLVPKTSVGVTTSANPQIDSKFVLGKDTMQPQVLSSTQSLAAKPPLSNDKQLEELILEANDSSLQGLVLPDFCKLCEVHHSTSIVALQHYRGKVHAKKVNTFLSIKANEEAKAALVATGVNVDDAKLCEVKFKCSDDATKHYSGADHARKQIERNNPSPRTDDARNRGRGRGNLDRGNLERRGIVDAQRFDVLNPGGRGNFPDRMMRESRPSFDMPEESMFEREDGPPFGIPDGPPFDPFDRRDGPPFERPDSHQFEIHGRPGRPPFNRRDEPPFNRRDKPPFNRHDEALFNRHDGLPFNKCEEPPFNRHDEPPFDRLEEPPFGRHDEPPFDRHNELPFNRHDGPPFDRHDGPPFNRHDGPPFDIHDEPPFDIHDGPSLGGHERPSFDRLERPAKGRRDGRGRERSRGNLNPLEIPFGREMEHFEDIPELDMDIHRRRNHGRGDQMSSRDFDQGEIEIQRGRNRGRGGHMSRGRGAPLDFDQEDVASRGRHFRQGFRGRGRPEEPMFKRGFQPRFNEFGPGPSQMKRPRKRLN